jgi:PST family polysaccharide transporter
MVFLTDDQEIFTHQSSDSEIRSASVKGSFVTLITQLIRMAVQFITQLILARILFPADFGLLAMVAPIVGLVQVVNDIGFGQVIVQRQSIYHNQISSLFWANLLFSILLASILMLSAPLFAYFYEEPKLVPIIIVMSIMIPFGALGIHPSALLSRKFRFVSLAKIDLLSVFLGSAVTISLSALGWNYWALVFGQIAATAAGVLASWLLCGWWPSRPGWSTSIKADFIFGRNITGTNLVNFVGGTEA